VSHRTCSDFRWQGVETRAYKDGEGPYLGVTRQTLFSASGALPAEWRYFEVAPGGHTTLERHEHVHNVLVLRGSGRALVGERVFEVGLNDLVHVPAMTWHQFRAGEEPLGFLCLVAGDRDRPILPTGEDLETLRAVPAVADFIRA
jgi:quercetin dioxygenase-like cupin family protein